MSIKDEIREYNEVLRSAEIRYLSQMHQARSTEEMEAAEAEFSIVLDADPIVRLQRRTGIFTQEEMDILMEYNLAGR